MQCLGYAYGYMHNLALDLNTLVFSRQENGKNKIGSLTREWQSSQIYTNRGMYRVFYRKVNL